MELNSLELLKLKELPKVWVDAVWEAEFCDEEKLDLVFEEKIAEGGRNVFKTVHTELLPFSNDITENAQDLWVLLKEKGISAKALVAVISHFINRGKSKNSKLEERLHGLQAASLYLLLLKIPGSVANQMFHQILFESSLGLIQKCWPKDSSGKKRKKDPPSSSQGKPKGRKRSKPQTKNQKEVDDADEDGEGDDDGDDDANEDMETSFSAQELMHIRNEIESLVKALLHLLKNGSLQGRPQCVNECVQVLTELTQFEPTVEEISFSDSVRIDRMRSLPELAYHGLWILCSSRGAGDTCLRSVFSRLLYVILMMSKDNMRAKPTLLLQSQTVLAARDEAIRFVNHVVDEMKDAAMPVLYVLAQHICDKMVEKVDYRTKGAQAVGQLVAKLSPAKRSSFIQWLYSYSLKPQIAYRLFALDVVMELLEGMKEEEEEEEQSREDGAGERPETQESGQSEFLSKRFLVQTLLFGRSCDVSPTVRAHALHCLSRCLDMQSHNTTKYVLEIFQASNGTSRSLLEMEGTEGTVNTHYGVSTFRTIQNTNANTAIECSSTPVVRDTLDLLKQRMSDAKTSVRKAAIEAITGLLKHNVIMCNKEHLSMLSERCRDPSVLVKKKAMQSLTDLLVVCPEQKLVQMSWLRGVVVSVMDTETSVQEKALQLLDLIILQHIKDPRQFADTAQRLAWDLLKLMCDECADLGCYFRKAFRIWSRQNKFSSQFVNTLIKHTETDHAPVAWMLLSKVAAGGSGLNYETILNKWDAMLQSKEARADTTCHILSVIGQIAENINDITRERIVEELKGLLASCAMPTDVIQAGVEALCRLGRAEHNQIPEFQAFMNKHCGELVAICQKYLSNVVRGVKVSEPIDTDMVVRHLYTLGVASLHCPKQVGERVFALVLSFLTTAVEIQPEGPNELPGSQPLSQFKLTPMSPVVRAHAVITLGQLCLQHEQLAHRCLPAFARELEVGRHMTVRSNVVVVLCDLCVRYTNMATLYVPNISACLADPVPDVREKTLIMLTNLLQEEFLKWKESLFFRYAAVVADPVPEIARLCEYCLVDRLLKKNPQMFYQYFVECIVHFNSYDKHSKYNKFPQTESEKTRFSLKGQMKRGKRFRIYKFLLKHFTDEHRFNTTNRISKEILAGFVDQTLPLDEDGVALLADAFDVLSLKELKLSATSAAEGSDEPQDEQAMMVKTMQKKLISHAQKKNFMENVIPIVLGLKTLLEEKCSPVLGNLMRYLQVITEDYRAELKEVFAADAQLAEELEFGLKQYQKQQEDNALEHQLQNLTFTRAIPKSRKNRRSLAGSCSSAPPGQAFALNHTSVPRPSEGGENGDTQLSANTSVSTVEPLGRAISTPQVGMHELTFGGSVSAIKYKKGRPQVEESDIFHVTIGDETPKQWNVQSPLRKNPIR